VLINATAVIESTRNSEPALKPKQARAERYERNAMRTAVRHLAFADVENGSERGDSRDVVHDDPAGKILHSPFRQDPTTPNHVDKRKVDKDQPRGQKQHVGLEGDAVGECAGDQRRRDDGEHHLIGAED
jgi:hypothetical protein